MGAASGTDSPGRGALFARMLGVLSLLVLAFPGGGTWVGTVEAAGDYPFVDSDFDGLSDRVEAYLSLTSTDPALAANPFNGDSDGDGQPDGFEFCLSDRQEVVSPGSRHSVVPTLTLGSHQEGDSLVLTLYVIPGDPTQIGDFHFLAAAPSVTGETVVLEATDLLVDNIVLKGSRSLVRYGPYSMAVYQARTSIALLEAFSSVAFAVVADLAGQEVGDSATFTVHHGTAYRWEYSSSGGETAASDGEAEPQENPGDGAEPQRVCLSSEILDPTGIPGVLVTVPLSTACNTGDWLCDGSVCNNMGPAAQPKVVLDHLLLLR
ncbi:MAG: hypothetical protein V2A76_15325 [Planctomycetota bacterium]